MSENKNIVEQHGCIVCGKIYSLLCVYAPDGSLVDCAVTTPGGRRVPDEKPIVACRTHSEDQVRIALERHYPGKVLEDEE